MFAIWLPSLEQIKFKGEEETYVKKEKELAVIEKTKNVRLKSSKSSVLGRHLVPKQLYTQLNA